MIWSREGEEEIESTEKEKKENSRIFQIFQIALFDLNNKQIIDCYVRWSFL